MNYAAEIFITALTWATVSDDAVAQAFALPEFSTPFAAEGRLPTGGQAAYGQAIAGRLSARVAPAQTSTTNDVNACMLTSPKKQPCVTTDASATDPGEIGNVTFEKWSANFAPVVVNVTLKK